MNNAATTRSSIGIQQGSSTATMVDALPAEHNALGWEPIIDTVTNWLLDLRQYADDGLDEMNDGIVRQALDIAESYKRQGAAPPSYVYPDPNGGIVFELRHGTQIEKLYLHGNGDVEYMLFANGRLEERCPLDY